MTRNLRFKIALYERKLTQRELAHQLGVDENMISRIVNGYQLPSPHLANSISKRLKAKPEELFPQTKPY